MTDGELIGVWGAIVGTIGGIAGGAIGAYLSIKNTNGPHERRFMIRCAIIGTLVIAVFLGIIFTVPRLYVWIPWVLYGITLPWAIKRLNKIQNEIRARESSEATKPDSI